MSDNLLALARLAAGRVAEAIPLFDELVQRMPTMSFPMSSLVYAAHLGLVDGAYAAADAARLGPAGARDVREHCPSTFCGRSAATST